MQPVLGCVGWVAYLLDVVPCLGGEGGGLGVLHVTLPLLDPAQLQLRLQHT